MIWRVCTLRCAHPQRSCRLSPYHSTMTVPRGHFRFDSGGVLPGSSTFMVLQCVFQNSWSAAALKVCSLQLCLKPRSPGLVPVSLRYSNFWHLECSSIHISLTLWARSWRSSSFSVGGSYPRPICLTDYSQLLILRCSLLSTSPQNDYYSSRKVYILYMWSTFQSFSTALDN